ncbi:MAG: hypothetical protein AVDCRST_MAG49-4288, partial [uncultured Thermomicrobiales bacterium]
EPASAPRSPATGLRPHPRRRAPFPVLPAPGRPDRPAATRVRPHGGAGRLLAGRRHPRLGDPRRAGAGWERGRRPKRSRRRVPGHPGATGPDRRQPERCRGDGPPGRPPRERGAADRGGELVRAGAGDQPERRQRATQPRPGAGDRRQVRRCRVPLPAGPRDRAEQRAGALLSRRALPELAGRPGTPDRRGDRPLPAADRLEPAERARRAGGGPARGARRGHTTGVTVVQPRSVGTDRAGDASGRCGNSGIDGRPGAGGDGNARQL